MYLRRTVLQSFEVQCKNFGTFHCIISLRTPQITFNFRWLYVDYNFEDSCSVERIAALSGMNSSQGHKL
jgi:hypothetical protein